MTSPASGWLRAGTVSIAAHALVILTIGFGAWLGRGRAARAPSPGDLRLPPVPMIDLSLAEDVLPAAAVPEPQPPEPPAASDAPASDSSAQAVPLPGAQTHRAPAPDSGAGAGRQSDVAWRRDRSTLRDHLANGADRYQPAHSRVATAAASPQADRREPIIGLGDAPRAARAASAPVATSLGLLDADARLRGGDTASPGAVEAQAQAATSGPPGAVAQPLDREGPLDTAQGTRAFDVARRAPAADDREIREASAELHPSVTDLSAPAAPGAGNEGHGRAPVPGPAARPAVRPASAPSLPGHLGPPGGTGAGSARERAHAHYESEIRARVSRALVFPRSLAVRLLLGETMLSFVVAADGRLDGPIAVTKSAGYEEFDRAAIEAVRRAAPFPPLPPEVAHETQQARSFALRVTFSNPVIR